MDEEWDHPILRGTHIFEKEAPYIDPFTLSDADLRRLMGRKIAQGMFGRRWKEAQEEWQAQQPEYDDLPFEVVDLRGY